MVVRFTIIGEPCLGPIAPTREVTVNGIYMALFWWAVIIVGIAVVARVFA